jgi:hypothetical protein
MGGCEALCPLPCAVGAGEDWGGVASAVVFAFALALDVPSSPDAPAESGARAFTPLRGASYFSLLVQRKDNQKKRSSTAEWLVKHTLPTRLPRCALQVHCAAGIFRRDIPVSSKNDVHPCTPPLRGLVRQLRRCGRGPGGAKPRQHLKPSNCTPPRPSPALCAREGEEQSNCQSKNNSHSNSKNNSIAEFSEVRTDLQNQHSRHHNPARNALTSPHLPTPPCLHPSIPPKD